MSWLLVPATILVLSLLIGFLYLPLLIAGRETPRRVSVPLTAAWVVSMTLLAYGQGLP